MDYTYFQNEQRNFVAKKLPIAKGKFIIIKDETDQEFFRDEIKENKPKNIDELKACYRYCYDDSVAYDVELDTFEEAIEKNKGNWLGDNKWINTYWAELLDYVPNLEDGAIEFKSDWQMISDSEAEELISTGLFIESNELNASQWKQILKKNKVKDLRELAKELAIDETLKKEPLINELAKVALKSPEKINSEIVYLQVLIKPAPKLKEGLKWAVEEYINDIKNAINSFSYPKMYTKAIWEYVNPYNDKTHLGRLISKEINKLQTQSESSKQNQTESIIEKVYEFNLKPSVKIAIEYINSNNESSNREIRLDKITFDNGLIYFYGFCYSANAIRTFRADRIDGDITLIETGELLNSDEFIKQYASSEITTKKHSQTLKTNTSYSAKKQSELFTKASTQKNNNPNTTNKPSTSSLVIGWFLGVMAIGGVGQNFEKSEFFAGMISFLAIGLVIPPILKKINQTNKKNAQEKGKDFSELDQKTANIIGFILIMIATYIAS